MSDYIQDIVNQIKGFISIEFGFCDQTGTVLGCSEQSKVGIIDENISSVLEWDENVCVIDDYVYQKYYSQNAIDFIVFIKNPNQEAINYIHAISVCIINLKNLKENYNNRASFVRSIILGEVLEIDIIRKAREVKLANKVTRIVFLIRTQKASKSNLCEVIQSIFPDENKDFTIMMDELNTVLIKEINLEEKDKIKQIASTIIETLNSEILIKAYVGISDTFENVAEIYKAYNQAQIALTVGGIFYSNKYILSYNKLGLGRLIYELPIDICKNFLKEVFKEFDEELLNEEFILTVNKLFENDLHVSETARQLYLHRNTLIYRLEKIQKTTGLDLKKFDDAVIFKIGLLIMEYLKKMPSNESKIETA